MGYSSQNWENWDYIPGTKTGTVGSCWQKSDYIFEVISKGPW